MIVAPSVLSLDYSKLNQQMNELNSSKAKWIHFDVMDGHFVPNLTFGPDILKGMKKLTDLVFDVHIMVSDPLYFAPIFINAGANYLTFHYEALKEEEIKPLIDNIHSLGAKAGISIKPKSDVKLLEPFLKYLDLVLIMSVEPGFGGQKFDESALSKIAYLKDYRSNKNLNYLIEVDGGINDQTIALVTEAGTDVVVSGSFIFKGDIHHNIDKLL